MKKPKILIADDEIKMRRNMGIILKEKGYDIDFARDGDEAWEKFSKDTYDLLLTDWRMPGMDGMELVKLIHAKKPDVPVIIITGYGSIDSAIRAMKYGAYDYITKPFKNEKIRNIIARALDHLYLKDENRYLREAINVKYNFDSFIGSSPQVENLRKMAAKVAATNSTTVLIYGESGTGKEIVTKLIHFNSQRRGRPFIAFNCAALPDDLLENELFGSEKGAFTGSIEGKAGKFELADTGTIFMDEIGDLSLKAQSKILRVLEERKFERIGGSKSIHVDVRIVAATNKDLKKMVEDGTFREDLYFRFNIFPLVIPPLRKRKEDIELIASYFLEQFSRETGKQIKGFTKQAMKFMISNPWQGNVRELKNSIERAVILCENSMITEDHLMYEKYGAKQKHTDMAISIPPGGISLEAVEKALIVKAMERGEGNKTRAAQLLKITRNALYSRLNKYNINQ